MLSALRFFLKKVVHSTPVRGNIYTVNFDQIVACVRIGYAQRKGFINLGAIVFGALLTLGFYSQNKDGEIQQGVDLASFPITVPEMAWGFAMDTLQQSQGSIQSGQFLADILIAQGVEGQDIQTLVQNASEVFNLLGMRAGKPLIQLSKDSTQAIDYLIYEPSVYEYIVFDLQNDLSVKKVKRPIKTVTESAAGIIKGSLWNAMVRRGYSYELTSKMEDALQWSVDFHHLQKDDEFRLIYEQDYVDGKAVGAGQVLLAAYKTADTVFYSLYFDGDVKDAVGYYDLDGKPMNAGFLRAPLKYSRISSYYNPNRLHPVLKYRRPHYGTDYAAPYGTPILAVANGTVSRAGYTGGNGNFVKIKHDETYSTQYLHMQKFASGIKVGTYVHQGQVIGYVGSTGLATGPHVCFRFWKNNKQVNHLKLHFPPAKPLADSLMTDFIAQRDAILPILENIKPIPLPDVEETTELENP